MGKDELVQIHPTKTTEGTLYAINSRYSFRLAKKVEDSSRTLVNMWEDPNELRKSEYFDHGLLQATASVFVPIMVESSWLCDLMKSKEMEVTALNEQYVDDEVYVELKFRCRQYFLNGHTKLLGGRILFDKKRYFVIKEYEVQTEFVADGISMNKNEKNSGSDFVDVEKKLEYQEIKGIPYLRRDETTYRKVKSTLKKEIVQFPNNKQTTNTDYEILDSNKVSGEVFFLKHYGFSEPINPLERTNIIRAILVALGLILTFLGLFMKIWARKIERE
ncbi:MAG: hypothetical protein LBJ00_15880 [Planctomycetaceae bacterium]|nr:hypothetical protein [Planctomycetaceae bacterium]